MWLCAGPPFTQKAKTKTVHDRSGQEISIYPGTQNKQFKITQTQKVLKELLWTFGQNTKVRLKSLGRANVIIPLGRGHA
jgi:hypothetical protein